MGTWAPSLGSPFSLPLPLQTNLTCGRSQIISGTKVWLGRWNKKSVEAGQGENGIPFRNGKKGVKERTSAFQIKLEHILKRKRTTTFQKKNTSGNIIAFLLLCDIVTRLSIDFYMGLLFLWGMPFLSIARPIWESNRRNWFWFCCWYTTQRGAKWWGEQRWKEFGTRERGQFQ